MYKSRLIYLAIIVASFIFSQALYEPVSYMTFIIVLILPVISVVLALLSYPLIKIKISASRTDVFRFEDFAVKISVKNYSPFISPSFKIFCIMPDDDGVKTEQTLFMVNSAVGSGGIIEYTRFFSSRGVYSVIAQSVEYYDFLKLIKIKKKIAAVVSVRSKPRNIELRLPVSSEQQKQDNSTFVGSTIVNSGGDMFGVRDYITGDNMKNVHWKLSAKNEELVMKTFAENIYDQAIVIADMSAYYDDEYINKSMTDCVVECALSAIRDYAKSSVRFSLIVNTSKNTVLYFPIMSQSDLYEASTGIMMTPMVTDSSVTDLLRSIDINTVSGCELCIITSFCSDNLLKNIKTMLIDQKSKLTVIRISEYEIPERDGVLSYTREYIELRSKSQTNEKN